MTLPDLPPPPRQHELPGLELEHDRQALWQAWQQMPRHERLDFEAAVAFEPLRRSLARQAGRMRRSTR